MEMMAVLEGIDRSVYKPLIFVRAESDTTSEVRVRRKEDERGNLDNCLFYSIPRSREVGQSYFTSVFTTIRSTLSSVHLVLKEAPDLLLLNGPGTCIPIAFIVFMAYVFLLRECPIVFTESFCRVDTISLSGKLLYLVASRFLVQWPQLAVKYPRAQYVPRLC